MSDTQIDIVERLREHYVAWGSPRDRDTCVNEDTMAYDCNEAARCIELLRAEVLAWRRAVNCGLLARTGEASTRTDDPRIAASIELLNARIATYNASALGATP